MPESTTGVTPLGGTTTVDDKMTFEPGRLSYLAARRIAAVVAEQVKPYVGEKPVALAGDAFLADLGNLGASKVQLEMLIDDYERISLSLTAAPAKVATSTATAALASAVVPAVTAGLQGALGLVALLRENVEFKGFDTKIDPRAFEIALAAQLTAHHVADVYVPDLIVVKTPAEGPESFRGKWAAMQAARQAAWQHVGPLVAHLARKDAELDLASRTGTGEHVAALSREVLALRRAVEPVTETLQHAEKRLADLQAQWDKTSETTGLTMLTRLLRAEAIEAKVPRYLHATVVLSGGHNRVSRNLFRMILLGDGLTSMGGVVVRWALLEPDGRFVAGNLIGARQAAKFPGTLGDVGGVE